jgi:uncharacterized protein YbaR (Trm112 family)
MPDSYTPEQQRALERAQGRGEALACPACGSALDRRAVPPRPDVSYVRDRLWLACPSCHRSVVIDRRSDA